MSERFTFTSARGNAVEFTPPFKLTDIAGLGVESAELQMTKAPFQDGQTLVDEVFKERSITLTVKASAATRLELLQLRTQLVTALNPKAGVGTFQWEWDDGTIYTMDTVPESCSFPGGKAQGPLFFTAQITLVAPEPYWKTPGYADSSALEGGLEFPVEFPVDFALVKTAAVAVNAGDVPAPVVFTILGPATNPKITNETTGEFIRIVYTIAGGEQIRVNTGFGEKEVVKVAGDGTETNIMNWLTADSVLWDLEVGDNGIQYTEEGGSSSPMALVNWKNRYVGR